MADSSNPEVYFKRRIYSIDHPGIRQEEMVDGYNNWTESYEQDLAQRDYSAPENAAMAASLCYPPDIRGNTRILDVGAGTGLVADKLHNLGFVHMDALDPCKAMLDVARQKGLYGNYFEEFLTPGEPTSIATDTYDCVTGAGCFGQTHIPWQSLVELIRIVKRGGVIVIATKIVETDFFRDFDLYVEKLVRNGKLSSVDRIKNGLYYKGADAITYVLKVV